MSRQVSCHVACLAFPFGEGGLKGWMGYQQRERQTLRPIGEGSDWSTTPSCLLPTP